MVAVCILHRVIFRRLRSNTDAVGLRETLAAVISQRQYFSNTAVNPGGEKSREENDNKWLILPPFTPFADGSEIGKLISRKKDSAASPATTALKWILICRPHLPRSLVQKLFRLRQVLISIFVYLFNLTTISRVILSYILFPRFGENLLMIKMKQTGQKG